MEETLEIDLREVFKVLLKRIWIILLCAVIVGGSVYAYTRKFVTPMYTASVTLYVNNNVGDSGTVSSSGLAVALQLVNTYVNIIQSDTVLNKVIDETGLVLTAGSIRGMLSAEVVDETEMFRVQITSPNPVMSADIANALANIAPAEISKIIEGSSAKVIDYAQVPTTHSSPNYITNTIFGALAGGLLAALFFVLLVLLDGRVKSEDDLTRICGVPVLGAIPDFTVTTKAAERAEKKVRR